ncbi:MAG: pseudouridine synthase [Candidatus Eremiobacterota bacterium]
MGTDRLQKILARAGLGSRRACEELIAAGRVRVNGVKAGLGQSADVSSDRITVDGRPVTRPDDRSVVLALHKPAGYVTTARDPQGRPTVMDLLPEGLPRVYPVGRLDRDSEGLLLFTNDGDLAHALMHPSHGVTKLYRVRVRGAPEPSALQRLEKGVELEEGRTGPARVKWGRGGWLEIELAEGKKRQVRRMLEAVGHPVDRLVRVRVGPVLLGRLRPGESRRLTASEVVRLRRAAGLGHEDGRRK